MTKHVINFFVIAFFLFNVDEGDGYRDVQESEKNAPKYAVLKDDLFNPCI